MVPLTPSSECDTTAPHAGDLGEAAGGRELAGGSGTCPGPHGLISITITGEVS